MKIAVNTRFLIPNKLEGFGHYTYEILSHLAQTHPEDSYSLYFDRPYSREFLFAENVSGHTIFPPARHPMLFYLWYQVALRRALNRYHPDVFFSPDSFMPLGMKCPSVITIHDVAHQPYPEAVSEANLRYYRRFMPRFIAEAKSIITVSNFSKREILKYYPGSKGKVTVIHNGVGKEFVPLPESSRSAMRGELTGGLPYFLYVGAIHPRKNVARLIDAYSAFRANTEERILLVIAGRKSWAYTDVEASLQRTAFRDDVLLEGYVPKEDLASLIGGALALCYVSLYEGFGLPVAEAMACGVPVIVTRDSAQAEVAGDAGIMVDAEDTRDIARALVKIARDQDLRAQCIENGFLRSKHFSWDTAAQKTYEILKRAVNK